MLGLELRKSGYLTLSFPGGSGSKESACNAGLGLIPGGSGRSPEEEENGYPLLYSCLENSMALISLNISSTQTVFYVSF